MSVRLERVDGSLADAPEIRRAVGRLKNPGRRHEAERFVAAVEALSGPARRDFGIALHPVQVRSKLWLIDELVRASDPAAASLVVLGGWYGVLPLIVNWRLPAPPARMVCIDIDTAACDVGARTIGSLYPNIEYRCGDLTELDGADLAEWPSPIVINTSCEHVPDLTGWWSRVPPGQLVVLQSNNYRGCPDHVNTVQSVAELKRQAPMSAVLFEGVLQAAHDLDRFMVIGRR
jgi:hypothetical protein